MPSLLKDLLTLVKLLLKGRRSCSQCFLGQEDKSPSSKESVGTSCDELRKNLVRSKHSLSFFFHVSAVKGSRNVSYG